MTLKLTRRQAEALHRFLAVQAFSPFTVDGHTRRSLLLVKDRLREVLNG